MVERAREAGVLLGGFFPMRFGVGACAVKRALDEGRFGRLVSLGARVKWWRDAAYYWDSTWRGPWALDGGGALRMPPPGFLSLCPRTRLVILKISSRKFRAIRRRTG